MCAIHLGIIQFPIVQTSNLQGHMRLQEDILVNQSFYPAMTNRLCLPRVIDFKQNSNLNWRNFSSSWSFFINTKTPTDLLPFTPYHISDIYCKNVETAKLLTDRKIKRKIWWKSHLLVESLTIIKELCFEFTLLGVATFACCNTLSSVLPLRLSLYKS